MNPDRLAWELSLLLIGDPVQAQEDRRGQAALHHHLHRMISTRKSKTFFAKVRDLTALALADEQRQ
jgi:hypothetical protein